MSSRTVEDQVEAIRVGSFEMRTKAVQQALDDVRLAVTQHGFTPEQVFGFHGKAELVNLVADADPSSANKVVANTAAVRRLAAAPRASIRKPAKAKPAIERAAVEESEAPKSLKTDVPAATVETALNPAASWPFPTGSRP